MIRASFSAVDGNMISLAACYFTKITDFFELIFNPTVESSWLCLYCKR